MSAAVKLREARFFLELLDALETRKSSLTEDASCGEEASYLMSAVLNSLYSALEQAKPLVGVESVQRYKAEHSLIFKGGGGLRNVTVHDRHVGPDHSGYIAPAGDALKCDLRKRPKLVSEAEAALPRGHVNLSLGANHYVEVDGSLVDITELCFAQYYALTAFLKEHQIVT